jgi:hypothetical protein
MGDVVAGLGDAESDQLVRRTLIELAEPDFKVVMVGPAYLGRTIELSGADGFREAWADWTEAFESYRIDLERLVDAGDRVVSLVTRYEPPGPPCGRWWTAGCGGSSSTSTARLHCGRPVSRSSRGAGC